MKKTAVVLMNLGGPNNRNEIKGFLYNLFSDKNIINLPYPFRQMLAFIISSSRKKKAQEVYDEIGGFSPILENTEKQKLKLQSFLGNNYEVFIAMRYSYPRVSDIIRKINEENYKKIILLPLYPQYSTTTSKSSIEEFLNKLKSDLQDRVTSVCCFYDNQKFIESTVNILEKKLENLDITNTTVLFSAHGLPKKIVEKGDPYCFQVEQTVKKVVEKIGKDINYKICYQSRVGPLEWVKPYTEDVIEEESKNLKNIVLVPIAFVSEHSETLVELDKEYMELALENGCPKYIRVPTQSEDDTFIISLKEMILQAEQTNEKFYQKRKCDKKYCGCINSFA